MSTCLTCHFYFDDRFHYLKIQDIYFLPQNSFLIVYKFLLLIILLLLLKSIINLRLIDYFTVRNIYEGVL